MTPQDHAKTLGIIYLLIGGFLSLLPLGYLIWAILVSNAGFERSLNFSKLSERGILLISGVFLIFLLTLSVLLAGLGLLKRKRVARVPAMIFSALAVFFFPLGTGLAIYTWWFLHSEGGKRMFSKESI